MILSVIDVERLARASSVKVRVDVAGKVARSYADGLLHGREKDVALDILKLLVQDAEVRVREALSQQLKECVDIPRDIAATLADDVAQVSIPMLQYSEALTDADLISIIASCKEVAKLVAVAKRRMVREPVANCLLKTQNTIVVTRLAQNAGAELSEVALLTAIEAMAKQESVIIALMERGGLPLSCVEKIFMTVSDGLKRELAKKYHVSRHLIEGKLVYAREMSTLGVIVAADEVEVEALVRQLHEKRKLTSSLVIRSLCVGDLTFFSLAMARLTGLPYDAVHTLMRDKGELGFEALYRQSPLPPAYFQAVRMLLKLVLEMTQNGKKRPHDFARQMIDKIKTHRYDLDIDYMPLLISIIKGNAGEFISVQ